MENVLLLANPLLLALLSSVVTFYVAAWLLGAHRTERDEARTGIALLCAMRWGEFSQLISEVLKDRGMLPASADHSPGKDGYDLLFTRGKTRYLVQCRNAAAQRITAATVGQLYALVQSHDADGAIIASCAPAEPEALKLAQDRRIEVIAEQDLWAHVKPWVAHDQRSDAEAAAAAVKRRRLLGAALIALLVAIAVYSTAGVLAPQPDPTPISPAPAPHLSPRPAPSTSRTPALPDAKLSDDQLASRRAGALLEVRGLSRIASAIWSTQSTLQVTLFDQISEDKLVTLVSDICRSLLQYEELRFTRLQIEIPTGRIEQPMQVRWRQCR